MQEKLCRKKGLSGLALHMEWCLHVYDTFMEFMEPIFCRSIAVCTICTMSKELLWVILLNLSYERLVSG